MTPQSHQKINKITEKSNPVLQSGLSELQGLILDVQDPILELTFMLFGPPEAHFRHFYRKTIARCTPQSAQEILQDCRLIVSQNAGSQNGGRRCHAAWRRQSARPLLAGVPGVF